MELSNRNVTDLGRAVVDELMERLGDELPGHLLVNLMKDADWLDRSIGEIEAANFLGLEVSTLQSWRSRGGGPRFVRPSARCVRYRRRDLIGWQRVNLVASTSEPLAGEV